MGEIRVQAIGDHYYFTDEAFIFDFAQVREHSDGATAELTTTIVATGQRTLGKVQLSSARSRAEIIRSLSGYGTLNGVRECLEECAIQILQMERQGEPAAPLVRARPDPARWLVRGLIPLGETTVIFGDGGSGKSLLAMALAIAGLTGLPLAGQDRWAVAPLGKVLYLDWESQRDDHAERLWGLTAMQGEGDDVPGLLYRPMARPLSEAIASIRTDARDADLVIVDSMAPACGPEPESADAAVRTLTPLRTLAPATRLVLAHVSKIEAEKEHGRSRPFGSIFNTNLPRSTISARAIETGIPDELLVTYTHEKINRGPQLAPRALRFCFLESGAILIRSAEPDLERSSLPVQILGLLRTGAKTDSMLAGELGRSPHTIKTVLRRLENRFIVNRFEPSKGGRGKETLWGLPDTNRFTGSS